MRRHALHVLTTLLVFGCGAPPAPASRAPEVPSPPPRAQGPAEVLPLCCRDYEQLKALDGQRVRLEGIYRPVRLQKRIGPMQEPPPGEPATVSIDTGELNVMLEIYYGPKGVRPAGEVDRLRGKRVQVVGTLHLRTPSQIMENGVEAQTMIGPYVGELESLEPSDRQAGVW